MRPVVGGSGVAAIALLYGMAAMYRVASSGQPDTCVPVQGRSSGQLSGCRRIDRATVSACLGR